MWPPLRFALIALSFVFILSRAEAQDYPTRPITIVVPYTPGGSTEILSRFVGQKLEERLGKSVVIENKPGAGTVIGSNLVAKSAPDGYTLMMATPTPMAINVTLHKQLPYDPASDLIPLVMVAGAPFVLVVNAALPVHSVKEFIAYAKERPGQLSYGSGGPGAPHHLYAELLASMTGIKMTHVPYKGTLPALNDVIAGHIQLMFSDLAPAYPLIQAGKVRALGVTTAQRAPAAPELPPLAEVGVPGFDWAAWQSVAVPGDTPKDIIAKLNGAVNAAVAEPEVTKQLVGLQFIPVGKGSPEELARFMASETARWATVLQKAGVAGSE